MHLFLAYLPVVFFPDKIDCESSCFKTSFDTNVHVEASISYPIVPEITPLAFHANKAIHKELHTIYDTFIQELWEEDGDDRTSHYTLHWVRSSSHLLSFYGERYEYRGGAHGSTHYITKTFWDHDGTIQELSLDDLFNTGSRKWLFQYCKEYFVSHRYGYYSDDDYSWVPFCPEDLESFLFTDAGLLLIFQNYVVDGLMDDPPTLLIPYSVLAPIARPDGPIGAKMVHCPSHLTCFNR